LGALTYQLIAPSLGLPGVLKAWHDFIVQAMPWLGASIPSFVLSLVLYYVFGRVGAVEAARQAVSPSR